MEAYCRKWESGDETEWCYLTNGLDASTCPGAIKSGVGDFYYSSHEDVCKGKETIWMGAIQKANFYPFPLHTLWADPPTPPPYALG